MLLGYYGLMHYNFYICDIYFSYKLLITIFRTTKLIFQINSFYLMPYDYKYVYHFWLIKNICKSNQNLA